MLISKEIPKSKYSKKRLKYKCDKCDKIYERRYDIANKRDQDLCKACSNKKRGEKQKGKKRPKHVIDAMIKGRQQKYPPLTLTCKYCHKNYTVPYGQRNSKFCSKNCQIKGAWHNPVNKQPSKKRKSTCKECKQEFEHYGEREYCSRDCNSIAQSRLRLGENNPAYKAIEEQDSSVCYTCNKEFYYTRYRLKKGQKRKFCSKSCQKGLDTREIDGSDQLYRKSKFYTKDWPKIRKNIIDRDKSCRLCESDKNLEVHHIDDDSSNNDEENLITLCKKCHNLTKYNRYFWQTLFIGLGSCSKIVKKGWGLEIHYVNNDKYCLKHLIFFKGKKFSLHKHILKKELWYCSWGKFKCILEDSQGKEEFIFKAGDKIEIEPTVVHQLEALTNCIITEVSTADYPEDSIRLEKGD